MFMASIEQRPTNNLYLTDNGRKNIIAFVDPKDYSIDDFKTLISGAMVSTVIGEPVRIHAIYPQGPRSVSIITERDLIKANNSTPSEFENFKVLHAKLLAHAIKVVFLRSAKRKNPLERFIENEMTVEL